MKKYLSVDYLLSCKPKKVKIPCFRKKENCVYFFDIISKRTEQFQKSLIVPSFCSIKQHIGIDMYISLREQTQKMVLSIFCPFVNEFGIIKELFCFKEDVDGHTLSKN